MSDTQQHPDWFRAHDGKWYPKERLPVGDHAAEPEPPSDRRWLLVAAGVGVVVAVVIVIAVTGGGDGQPGTVVAPTSTVVGVAEPSTVLDQVFPDRPDDVVAGPTPDPVGAGDAATALELVEASWVRSAFDDLDFVVVVRNRAEVAFGNVKVDAIFVDRDGTELTREPFSYRLVPAGGEVVLSGLRPIDPDAVAEIRVEVSARGSVPDAEPTLEVVDFSWEQDPTGTVALSGSLVASSPTEFVSVVGILRDSDGAFLGTAFAFVDAVTDQPRAFEALGFPDAEVADVEVHVNG